MDKDLNVASGGRPRDPLVDTGFPGIVLSRRSETNRYQVTVLVLQNIQEAKASTSRPIYYPVGSLSERRYRADTVNAVEYFKGCLAEAMAIRSLHDLLHSINRPPVKPLTVHDVPAMCWEATTELPVLDLDAIFESCRDTAKRKGPRTRNNDPGAELADLIGRDLKRPGHASLINGFHLAFKRYELADCTLYLPRSLYRARNEWRVRVICSNGPWTASVPDLPDQSSPLETLDDAWQVLVASLGVLKPDPNQRGYKGEPLLWTGVEHLTFNVMKATAAGNAVVRFKLQLRYQYHTPNGLKRRVSLGYWSEKSLNDQGIAHALRKGAALANYYQSLGSRAPEKLDSNIAIPCKYWPDMPTVTVTADDLLYYIERLESGLTLKTRNDIQAARLE